MKELKRESVLEGRFSFSIYDCHVTTTNIPLHRAREKSRKWQNHDAALSVPAQICQLEGKFGQING